MFRRTGKGSPTCHFYPISGWTQARFQVDGRYAITKFLWRSFYFVFNYFHFSSIILFLRGMSTTAFSLILLFVQSVPSLFPLSFVLFVVSWNGGEDGTTNDTICRPGCLPRRPPTIIVTTYFPLPPPPPPTLISRSSRFPLDEPERSPPT